MANGEFTDSFFPKESERAKGLRERQTSPSRLPQERPTIGSSIFDALLAASAGAQAGFAAGDPLAGLAAGFQAGVKAPTMAQIRQAQEVEAAKARLQTFRATPAGDVAPDLIDALGLDPGIPIGSVSDLSGSLSELAKYRQALNSLKKGAPIGDAEALLLKQFFPDMNVDDIKKLRPELAVQVMELINRRNIAATGAGATTEAATIRAAASMFGAQAGAGATKTAAEARAGAAVSVAKIGARSREKIAGWERSLKGDMLQLEKDKVQFDQGIKMEAAELKDFEVKSAILAKERELNILQQRANALDLEVKVKERATKTPKENRLIDDLTRFGNSAASSAIARATANFTNKVTQDMEKLNEIAQNARLAEIARQLDLRLPGPNNMAKRAQIMRQFTGQTPDIQSLMAIAQGAGTTSNIPPAIKQQLRDRARLLLRNGSMSEANILNEVMFRLGGETYAGEAREIVDSAKAGL